jgi:hypothetical protein
MIDLSVIVLNYNNSDMLKGCLKSVYDSTSGVSFEVIVVDNASTDDSLQMVKANFPKARIIENRMNLGFSKANNMGLAAASGKYCMLLNNDTIVKDGAFKQLVEFMDKTPTCGACGPKLLNEDGSVQRQGGIFAVPFWRAKSPVSVSFLMGACLMVRREVVKSVGMLDENLFFYNDDLDWVRRIKGAGHKLFFVPSSEVIHFGGGGAKQTFNRRMFIEGFRGGLYFCKKHYGALAYHLYRFTLALFFPLSVLLLAFSVPFRGVPAFKERLSAYYEILRIALFGPVEYPWK